MYQRFVSSWDGYKYRKIWKDCSKDYFSMKLKNCQPASFGAFWEVFEILYQIFFSPQAKRSVIISNQHRIYELPHERLKT